MSVRASEPAAAEPVPISAHVSVAAFRAGAWLSRRVSYDRGRRLAMRAGAAFCRAAPAARGNVERNLSRVLGHPRGSALLDAAVVEAFRSYFLYWFETFHVRAMPFADLVARTRFVGLEHLDAAVAGGRGGILALPHIGNWDAAARWVTGHGYSMTAVAEELKPEAAFRLFLEHRRALGLGIVALGGKRVGEELIRLLGANELLCLVADRDLSGRGVEVDMFGAPVQLPAGPAMLSLTTGAPLMVCAVYHVDGGGWEVVVSAPVEIARTDSFRDDVTALTRLVGAGFERGIASAPTMWHMFQDYWG
jgi:phosphatidylinositol dimannoside acyltransferase